MERTLSFERTYAIGNMNFAKFGDTITNIPEHLAVNPEVISTLRMLQIVQTEKAFFTYMSKKEVLHSIESGEALEILEEANHKVVQSLKEVISQAENNQKADSNKPQIEEELGDN